MTYIVSGGALNSTHSLSRNSTVAFAALVDDNTYRNTVLQIDMEEYGVALDLARKYNLDCDLVYQRQWRNTPVSVTSIQDYLVSILP